MSEADIPRTTRNMGLIEISRLAREMGVESNLSEIARAKAVLEMKPVATAIGTTHDELFADLESIHIG